jgi:hypothetical protein
MRIVDRSQFRDDNGEINLENKVRGVLQNGFKWLGQMTAMEKATNLLERSLDRDHVLLREATIPGTTITIPMILISPQGVHVILPSSVGGNYRARGTEWQVFDGRARQFKNARPNIIEEGLVYSQSLHRFLEQQGFPLPEVETVLLFTDPRTHVDSIRPEVRVVLTDAVEHFVNNMLKNDPVMDQEDILAVRDAILETQKLAAQQAQTEAELAGAGEKEYELAPAAWPTHEPPAEADQPAFEQPPEEILPFEVPRFIQDLGMTPRQWVIIGLMAFIELVVLIVLAVVIISGSF